MTIADSRHAIHAMQRRTLLNPASCPSSEPQMHWLRRRVAALEEDLERSHYEAALQEDVLCLQATQLANAQVTFVCDAVTHLF